MAPATFTAVSFSDNGEFAKKKQKVFPIDEADYLVLEKILQCMGFERGEGFQPLMKILNDDKQRGIRTLHRKAGHESHLIAKILHPSFGQLQNVRELTLIDMKSLKTLPEEVGNFSNLFKLSMASSGITSLPTSIGRLQALRELRLVNMKLLRTLPEEIGNLVITSLPEEIGNLGKLKWLKLTGATITSLPTSIGRLQNLEILYSTHITSLPEAIGSLVKLRSLCLRCPGITSLPAWISRLQDLETLTLGFTGISSLPEGIGSLGKLRFLGLMGPEITALPAWIGRLQNLETLKLHFPLISSLPEEIGSLSKLWSLVLTCPGITYLPACIGRLKKLEELDLSRTKITSLPASIGRLQKLEVLNLASTKYLKNLPKEIGNLEKLCILDLRESGIGELSPAIGYSLACRRFKHRRAGVPIQSMTTCWPIILENAVHTFRNYDKIDSSRYKALKSNTALKGLKPHDAVYRILSDYKEMLINRNN